MWVERIEDLETLGLAPPLVWAAAEDVLGEPPGEWEADDVGRAVERLKAKAARDAIEMAQTNDAERYAEDSAKRRQRHAAIFDGCREDVAELLDLALARLSGRASPRPDREESMTTKTAARRTKAGEAGLTCEDFHCPGPPAGQKKARKGGRKVAYQDPGTAARTTTKAGGPIGTFEGPRIPEFVAEERARAKAAGEPVCRLCGCSELADSIRKFGVLQAVLVRPKGDRYELVFGERRLRASRLAGAGTIPARVQDLTDAEAADLCAEENAKQNSLNAIEEARQIEILAGVGHKQEEIAALLGKTQPWVSNRLRLLGLPDQWKARIISHEMPATHARELVAWAHRPQVLERVEKELAKRREAEGRGRKDYVPTVREFQGMVRQAAHDASRSLREYDCGFKMTAERKAELDVEEVESWYGGGKEPRAFNVRRYNELRKEAREAKKKAVKKHGAAAGRDAYRPPRGPQTWDVERRVRPWLCRQILDRVRKADKDLALRLLLALDPDGSHAWAALGVRPSLESRAPLWRALCERSGAELAKLPRELVTRCLGSDDRGPRDVRLLCEVLVYLGGEPLAYELTAKDLDLYEEDLLRKMPPAKSAVPAAKRPELVAAVLAGRDGWLPREFEQVLSPARPRTPRKPKPR